MYSGRRDRMVVAFTTTYGISAYYHWREFESHSGEVYSIQHYVIKFVRYLQQVSGIPVSSTNKTDRNNIAELLLTVALNTITITLNPIRGSSQNCSSFCLISH